MSSPVDLSKLFKKPANETFRFVLTKKTLVKAKPGQVSDLELTLEYMDQRSLTKFVGTVLEDKATRRAGNTKGAKVFESPQDRLRKDLVERVLLGWKLTPRGAFGLAAEMDFSGMDPDQAIDFTPQNVAAMSARSELPNFVYGIVGDHTQWFQEPGAEEDVGSAGEEDGAEDRAESGSERLDDSAKNSETGPSSSTAG